MSMSNAQAALLAAAATDTTGDTDNVYYLAEGYLRWLDRQDVPQPQRPRCTASTPGGLQCDKEEAHDGGHISTADGIGWQDVDTPPRVIVKRQLPTAQLHFEPSRDAHHTTCGRERNAGLYLPTTSRLGDVTCQDCKVALGL